ncbi:site-specific integrase [Salmonella enterica subsp. enterica serovar Typhimurium]|nr:site-specific integrase [Salmonella enterica subsp. enterica serovar Mountpleasant]EHD9479699.1 site-specific integrase [Salmonella enterica subsp. enterica serovar Typhimurium]
MSKATNKLSDSTLKKIAGKPTENDRFFSDGDGLQIKHSKNGILTWYFKYRTGGRDGVHFRLKLGNYPDMSIKVAREKRAQCRAWLAEGKNPKYQLNAAIKETLTPVTVKDALGYWLKEYAAYKRKDCHKLEQKLNKHIISHIGEMPLSQCETYHWLECFDRIKRKHPVVSGHMLQASKQALKFCRRRRYAFSNALDDLIISDVGRKAASRDRVHSPQEMRDILRALDDGTYNPYYSALIRLLIVFGCRTAEVRLSEVREWDLRENVWTVPKEHSKTSVTIYRPIPDAIRPLIETLINQHKHTGLLLGEMKADTTVSQYGRQAHKRLKHAHWTLHDFRHTFTTMLNDIGIEPHIVEHLTAHQLPGMQARYNHARYLPKKLEALNLWAERLDVLAGKSVNVVVMKPVKQGSG